MLEVLHPKSIWTYFEEIARIPRPSKHEGKIIAYLIDFAKHHNLACKKDAVGNVLISKNGTSSVHKNTVVLQSHVDMVCEKNAIVTHDFLNDAIHPIIEGDWVKAKGTTLGADDGIGVAAMLALLADPTIEHGPLECLFTIDEESGLTGAFELEKGFFKGKVLLNLDSEDEGELFIGCAGGIDTFATFQNLSMPIKEDGCAYHVSLTGLVGGHSGDEIHKSLANAIKILNEFLVVVSDRFHADLHRFEGGNLKNAIPREAFATLIVPCRMRNEFIAFGDDFRRQIQKEFNNEHHLEFLIQEIAMPENRLDDGLQKRLLKAIKDCPHGVIAWSKTIDGLVETSTNLASIKFVDNEILITTSQRSSVDDHRIQLAQEVSGIFQKAGATSKHSNGYPGWTPNLKSDILTITVETYEQLFHAKPLVKAIHAGLECGLFLEKYPDLDMISFGPTIKGAHSPDERLHIPSVQKFWGLLLGVLKRID